MSESDEQSSHDQSSLDPDEPHTPPWFTFLGLCLFLVGGIFLLATAGDDEMATGLGDAAAEEGEETGGEGAEPVEPTEAPVEAPDPHAGHDH